MLETRNYAKWWKKQQAKRDSQNGWKIGKGYFHEPRRSEKYSSHYKMYARKSFGRHPNANFLKG